MRQENAVNDSELMTIREAELQALMGQGAMREALLQEKLTEGRVRCNICQRRCNIPVGKSGYCMTKVNVDGTLFTTIYGVVSSAAADPIEKKPVYHFKPGSRCFSVGSLGCNFRCAFCQNWQIAFADSIESSGMCRTNFMPEDLIASARETNSDGVAWTYNEPGIWLNYTLDCAKLAKKAGLYTVYVTNGYATEEHLDTIGPYLDVYRVDIKSMSADFYRKLIKVPSVTGILDITKRAKQKWNMHIECVTNIIPGWNDSEENLRETACWIAENLGELTPWHVTRFFPYAQMQDVPPTPPETVLGAMRIGHDAGLKFVYIGNLPTAEGQDTICYTDGTVAIERSGYSTKLRAVTAEGMCATDGTDLNIRM